MVAAPITEYFHRKIGQVLWTPLLFFGSERISTETASEQPTGDSGITSEAEEEGFKAYNTVQECARNPNFQSQPHITKTKCMAFFSTDCNV